MYVTVTQQQHKFKYLTPLKKWVRAFRRLIAPCAQNKRKMVNMINIKKFAVLVVTLALVTVSFAYVFAGELQSGSHGVGVLKSADRFAYVGDLVTYQIRVYNPSDYDLYNINLTDTMLGFNDTIPFMAAGNTTGVTYIFHREVLETDPNPLINTVSVEAIDSEGAYSSASTQAITIIAERLIGIEKIGPNLACQGEKVKYTIMVDNTADTDLVDVVVEDEMLGFSWKGDLNVGESNVFNLTYTVPCDAEDTLTNTVTVWAQLNETAIYAEASWTTEILHPCVPHSMGYWKNHPEDWPADKIEIGNINYTKEEALDILIGANARDATRMLAAQLITAKLNRLSGASPCFYYCNDSLNIDNVISDADDFLATHTVGSNPSGDDRQVALKLKDTLDAYNNSGCD